MQTILALPDFMPAVVNTYDESNHPCAPLLLGPLIFRLVDPVFSMTRVAPVVTEILPCQASGCVVRGASCCTRLDVQ